ncbi:MAG: hypothetical protein IJD58_08710 [Lachnospiraceae bacterium]|nr:hypothetical protein [Lachnospiraceae bacterium]
MLMKILNDKDIKRNKILFVLLGLSLFFIPFASNIVVRIMLTFLVVILFLNALILGIKCIKYWLREDK